MLEKSKILLYFLISFISGVALASFWAMSNFIIFVIIAASLFLLVIFWHNRIIRILFLSLIFLAFGLLRFSLVGEAIYNLGGYQEKSGLVYEEPERSGSQKIKLKTNEANILITADLYPEYHYGDELLIKGEIEKPENFEGFDYQGYLSRYDIYWVGYQPQIKLISSGQGNWFKSYIYLLRNKFSELIKQSIKEPEASIFQAMALGIKRGISEETSENFSKAGVSHIIAISGLHITIIAGILMNLCLGTGFSRRRAFWLASGGLILFILLVGAPASAVRAGIMGFLVLLAMYLGRLNNSVNAFVLAGALMLLFNPKLLRYDIGFQLSFLAVLGLIYVGPYFKKILSPIPDLFNIKSTVLMTLSAQVFTLPLIIYYFQRVSLIAPIANVLILPVLPFILIIGFMAVFVSLFYLPFGQIIFWPCYLLLKYLTLTINFLADLKWSSFEIKNFDFTFLLFIYLFVFVFLKIIKKPPRRNSRAA